MFSRKDSRKSARPAAPRRSGGRTSFSIERLEDRKLMAGDVLASLVNGSLILKEATGQAGMDNSVRVSQLDNGMIRVSSNGTLGDGSMSLINGQDHQDFLVPGNLTVNFGKGNDLIVFDTSAGYAPQFGSVTLNMGPTSAPVDTDNDDVIVFGLQTRAGMTVNTGAGDDWVFLGGATIGDGVGTDNLNVNSGAGADNVTLKYDTRVRGDATIVSFSSATANEVDTAYFDLGAKVDKNLNVRLGGGDDLVFVSTPDNTGFGPKALTVGGTFNLQTGAGADVVFIARATFGDDVGVDNLIVNTGAGADKVTVSRLIGRVTGNLDVTTYSSETAVENDVVNFEYAYSKNDFNVRTGAGDDVVTMFEATSFDDLLLETGLGNDQATLKKVIALDALMADMGEGNDTLRLENAWAANTNLLGGLGSDNLWRTSSTLGNLFADGWERINGIPTWFDDIVFEQADIGVLTRR